MDERAHALVREHLGEQPLADVAADHVHAGDPRLAGGHGVARFRDLGGPHRLPAEGVGELGHGELAGDGAVDDQTVGGGDVEELDRAQGPRHLERHRVGVEAVGPALAVEAQRGDDGHDAAPEQGLEQLDVHPLHAPGEEVVDAAQDAEGVGDDRVRGRGAQVGGGEALEDLVGQAVGGGEGEAERGRVGDPGALEVGRLEAPLLGQRPDLDRLGHFRTSRRVQRWSCHTERLSPKPATSPGTPASPEAVASPPLLALLALCDSASVTLALRLRGPGVQP